uniref:Uncharacterized protein n=1 Tax=Chromera velia CCMP2878 TaxID=1169474 RepID=A0A0G4HMI6_9ALVE|eukprot:Cvel_29279.t1-p1 / transcript=Cvel_29279.t1 / gene=Cvel_29279 / organism=Chromera_velia_CCMP2878 / gene_product=hypothetical protein / transcript_product=hypothetical protein / location=Cvel_scaffold3977:954-1815(+) / protein_length=214 / sequence_SO=supercontig / SO=protein_coding / is_pseudo=false
MSENGERGRVNGEEEREPQYEEQEVAQIQNGEEEEKQSDANSDKGGAGVGIDALLAAVSSNGRRDQQQQQASSSSSSSSSAAAAAVNSTQARRPSTLLPSLVKKSNIRKKTLPAETARAAALKEGLRVSLKRKGPETRAPSPPAKEGRRETAVDVSDEEPNYDLPDDGQFSSSEPDETAPLYLTFVRQKPCPSPQEGEIPTLREPEVFSTGDVP